VAEFRELWLAASAPPDTSTPHAPRLAGRKGELATVRRHLETGSGLLLVTGEAGLGKTRLVSTASASVADVYVAAGTCLPLSTDVPLLPVSDLLRAAYDVDAGQWLEKSLGTCATYVAGALSRLLPELAPWAEADDGTDGWARERLFAAVGAALRALAVDRPVGLLIEDLHWADASTLDLLEHLLCRPINVPILGTFRLDDPQTAPTTEQWRMRIMRLAQVTHLDLRPLSRDETAVQLALLLGRGAEPRLVDRIHARARGQPLFAELLARSGEDDQPLPRLLSDLLDQRLDTIGETASAVAVALGVAGRSLGGLTLCRITGLSRPGLAAALRELDRARLIDPATTPGEIQLRHSLAGRGRAGAGARVEGPSRGRGRRPLRGGPAVRALAPGARAVARRRHVGRSPRGVSLADQPQRDGVPARRRQDASRAGPGRPGDGVASRDDAG
jgi:hypothetical protein